MSAIKPGDYVEEDRGFVTPCWIWQLSVGPDGYGRARRRGRRGGDQNAPVVYYEELVGPVPDGLVLDHLCCVRACVNPAHLEALTQLENCHRGGRTKLSSEDVAAIRASTDSTRALARRFGVHHAHVSRIRTGHRWPADAQPVARRRSETA